MPSFGSLPDVLLLSGRVYYPKGNTLGGRFWILQVVVGIVLKCLQQN